MKTLLRHLAAAALLACAIALHAADTIEFAHDYFSGIDEKGKAIELAVVRKGSTSSEASVRLAVTAIDANYPAATLGVDFTIVPEVVVFAPGEDRRIIVVTPVDDTLFEKEEGVFLRLTEPRGADVGALGRARVSLNDDERGFYSFEPSVSETVGQVLVQVHRSGTLLPEATVDFATAEINVPGCACATAGLDFVPTSGTLRFAAGQTASSFPVTILNDSVSEGDEYISIRLSNPTQGIPVDRASGDVWIQDNERGYRIPYDLSFRESEGDVEIVVLREGDFDFASSVDYRVESLLPDSRVPVATLGQDFEPARGTIRFEPGQTRAVFPVRLHQDNELEGVELIQVFLENPIPEIPWSGGGTIRLHDAEQNPVRIDPNFTPAVPADGYAVIPQPAWPDGRLLVGSSLSREHREGVRLYRLMPDGSVDPSFMPADVVPLVDGFPLAGSPPVPLADGGALVPATKVNNVPVHLLARLKPDGGPDSSFQVPRGVDFDPIQWVEFALTKNQHVVLSLGDGGNPGRSRLYWLDQSGSPGDRLPVEVEGSFGMMPQADGSVWLAGAVLPTLEKVNGKSFPAFARIRADGTVDDSFPRLDPAMRVAQLVPTPSGTLALLWLSNVPDGESKFLIHRLTSDGSLDPTFQPYRPKPWHSILSVLADSEGFWVFQLTTGFQRPPSCPPHGSLDQPPHGSPEQRLIRFNSDGSPAQDRLPLELEHTFAQPNMDTCGRVLQMAVLPDGNLLAWPHGMIQGHWRPTIAKLQVTALNRRIEVAARSARVVENAGTIRIPLVRAGDIKAPWTVRWRTEDLSARAGVDYVAGSGEVTFPAGESEAAIEVTLLDNRLLDEDRALWLRFAAVPDGVALLPAQITIVNDELGFVPGSLRVFPGGAWIARPTGIWTNPEQLIGGGGLLPGRVFLEASTDLFRTTLNSIYDPRIWFSPGNSELSGDFGQVPQLFLRLRREE